jgi:hypothetical protein
MCALSQNGATRGDSTVSQSDMALANWEGLIRGGEGTGARSESAVVQQD